MPIDTPVFAATDLPQRWQQRAAPLFAQPAAAEKVWQQLSRAYSAAGRHYHALPHLRTMFAVLDAHPDPAPDPAVLELAVWFHDVVYQSLRSDNEARSAEQARQLLQATTLRPDQHQRLGRLIERTQHHGRAEPDDALDTHLLLDADLWVLGAEPTGYQEYARQVRQEYLLVPGLLYRRGRRRVLESLLDAPTLYHTPWAQAQREAPARRNLAAELATL
ncbi:hypothetical protein [Hymenobacter sp. B81]|uniref:hypothetical protein n=1 Tax=Hymenobacter sp. B81 TaxID=3344878 RepID=UPI0037DCBB44